MAQRRCHCVGRVVCPSPVTAVATTGLSHRPSVIGIGIPPCASDAAASRPRGASGALLAAPAPLPQARRGPGARRPYPSVTRTRRSGAWIGAARLGTHVRRNVVVDEFQRHQRRRGSSRRGLRRRRPAAP